RCGALVGSPGDLAAVLADPGRLQRGRPGQPRILLRFGTGAEGTARSWSALCRDLPGLAEAATALDRQGLRQSPRLGAPTPELAGGRRLRAAGGRRDRVHGEGLGRWTGLALPGVVSFAAALEGSGGSAQGLDLQRPALPVFDPVTDSVLRPWRVEPVYLAGLW